MKKYVCSGQKERGKDVLVKELTGKDKREERNGSLKK